MIRAIEPELLDHLPPEDPMAIGSRRDLRRVNAWMGNAALLETLVSRFDLPQPLSVLELGAGDGTLLLRLARRLPSRTKPVTAVLLDRQPVVTAETIQQFRTLNWNIQIESADVFEWLDQSGPRFDLIVTNLFLHHFDTEALCQLFQRAALRTDAIVALEPRRSRLVLMGARLLGLIGCNRVTRHDARVSVHAGFSGQELSACWPTPDGWHLVERPMGLFSHGFSASRTRANS